MNIFILDTDPVVAAQSQCDKHVVKMVTESAQMLSTAHRVLDGAIEKRLSSSGKTIGDYWALPDSREHVLMRAVHMKHPCTVWTMQSAHNYNWHYEHYCALSEEYSHRYGKQHGAFYNNEIGQALKKLPQNISVAGLTQFPLAMKQFPQCIVEDDIVQSYQNFYREAKADFAKWTRREIPAWYVA